MPVRAWRIFAMRSFTVCCAFSTSLSRALTPMEITAVSALIRVSPVPLTVIRVSAAARETADSIISAASNARNFFILFFIS